MSLASSHPQGFGSSPDHAHQERRTTHRVQAAALNVNAILFDMQWATAIKPRRDVAPAPTAIAPRANGDISGFA
jgi:hypothetical protein